MQPLTATECPPGLPSPEAQALFDWHASERLLPRLRAKGSPPQVSGLKGIQACGLLLPAGTGGTSLATGLGNLTHRGEVSWYIGGIGYKHLVTFRHVRLTNRPCALMTVRDPYERLRSGFRYDTAHKRDVHHTALISHHTRRRTLHELLDAFRNVTAPEHAMVMSMYNHSVTSPTCRSDEDQCIRKRTPESPMNPFLHSQSTYLLDDFNGSMPTIHFLCTNNYVASWRALLVAFGIESSVPPAYALSGRAPAAADTLPYNDADARFVRNCLYPWDTYLNQHVCGSLV